MFAFIRSAAIWTYLIRFRRRLIFALVLLLSVLLSNLIYADIVEYLTLTNRLEHLDYILPAKWLLTIFGTSLALYLIFAPIFRLAQKKRPKETKKIKKPVPEISEKEKKLLSKKARSRAEIIMEKEIEKN